MTAVGENLDDYLIVDSGAHLHETPVGLMPYCDPHWLGSLEAAERSGQASGSDFWPPSQDVVETAATPAAMRAGLSAMNVDIAVLFPDSLIQLPTVPNVEYAAALARAYNAWLADQWCRPEDGLLGVLVACPQAPEDTATEIEKYARHPGVAGVYLPGTAVYPMWGHRHYDPIFRAAEAADLPVLLHTVEVVHPVFPFNTHGYASGFARHATAETFSIMANVIDMMSRGVPARFPKLRIALTGAGLSWAPFLGLRLDKVYLEYRRLVPFLSERPSAYLSRFFIGTHPLEEAEDPADLVTLMSLFNGEDQAVFASAWPHRDFDHPGLIDRMPLSAEAKQKILGGNALRLFNIDAHGTRLALTTAAAAQ